MRSYFCEDTSLATPCNFIIAKLQNQRRGKKGGQFSLVASAVMAPCVPLVHLREEDPAVSDLLGFQRKHHTA